MPAGKIKWYDAEKGFGFISSDDGEDVFVRSDAVPAGAVLKGGTRVEFGVVTGRRGAQARDLHVVAAPASLARAQHAKHRPSPEDMTVIVEDLITLLDSVSTQLHKGRYPEPKAAAKVAAVLRAVATDLDGE